MALITQKWNKTEANRATQICATILLIFILKLFVGCVNADFTKTDCAEFNYGTRCQCDVKTMFEDDEDNDNQFEIHCFSSNLNESSQFILTIANYDLEIACNVSDINIFNYLPSLNIGVTYKLEFQNCTEFELKYSADIFIHWNIQIEYQFSLKSSRSPLTKNQLKGLHNANTLTLENYNLSYVSADLFRGLNPSWLNLEDNIIDELHPNAFVTLEKLEALELPNNNIKLLPPGIFQNQKKLRLLYLKNNQLYNLSKDSFEGAVSTQKLNLQNNFIKSIPADTFSALSMLRELKLDHNNLVELPIDVFANNAELSVLSFGENFIQKLQFNLFNTLKKLSVLNVHSNNITYLPPGIFRNNKELRKLNLENNQLKTLRKDCFEGAVLIQWLDLRNNLIESIQADTFSGLYRLEELNLDHNNLIALPGNLFAYNAELRLLSFGENFIQELHLNLFESLQSLIVLKMHSNNITYLPPGIFRNKEELIQLYLENNELKNLSRDCFEGASSIEYLNLQNNSIETIEADTFSALSKLKDLNLDFNNLSELPEGLLISNKNLNIFSLRQTQKSLHTVPHQFFAYLPSLEEVTLSCGLTSLPTDIFWGSNNLKYIDLSQNNNRTFEEWKLGYMPQLHTLDLSYCGLHYLSSLILDIGTAPKLNTLILSHNDLSETTKFKRRKYWNGRIGNIGSSRIHMLDISFNKIRSLNDKLVKNFLTISENVILSNNEISEVYVPDIKFLDLEFSLLSSINLNNNPLNCDCKLLQFHQFLKKPNSKIYFEHDELICEEPSDLQNEHVLNVSPDKFVCLIDKSLDKEHKLCPGNCECWRRPYDSMLIINCTNGRWAHENELSLLSLELHDLRSTQLSIASNNITQLPTNLRDSLTNVTQIYAANNQINNLDIRNLPRNLSILDLRSNHLQRLSSDVLKAFQEISSLQEIYLSENQWICDCEAMLLLQYTKDNTKKIQDLDKMYCVVFNTLHKFNELSATDICPTIPTLVYIGIVITLIGILIGITSLLYIKYDKHLKVWLYSHKFFLRFISETEVDKDKLYDAFVSYAHQDEQFVVDHLHPQLELPPNKFKLCIHVRDWKIGELVTHNIWRSVADSRRIIFVLSNSFIKSEWSRWEFQAAHQATLKEKRSRIIVILYEDINDTSQIDDELALYLQTSTYLKWGDPWFWEKLHYALPHPIEESTQRNNGIEMYRLH